jgi:P-type Cu+ transporter
MRWNFSVPCALGIATPMVVSLGIDKAAREGILIKGGRYLESLASIDTIVFDKTGTLTKGKPEVTDIIPAAEGFSKASVLQLADSAEVKSEHPIAQAIVNMATKRKIPLFEVSQFQAITSHGVIALHQQGKIFVGSPTVNNYDSNNNILPPTIAEKIKELESEGKTVVSILIEDRLVGIIAIADTVRDVQNI